MIHHMVGSRSTAAYAFRSDVDRGGCVFQRAAGRLRDFERKRREQQSGNAGEQKHRAPTPSTTGSARNNVCQEYSGGQAEHEYSHCPGALVRWEQVPDQ
jgi:hypothetical protein